MREVLFYHDFYHTITFLFTQSAISTGIIKHIIISCSLCDRTMWIIVSLSLCTNLPYWHAFCQQFAAQWPMLPQQLGPSNKLNIRHCFINPRSPQSSQQQQQVLDVGGMKEIFIKNRRVMGKEQNDAVGYWSWFPWWALTGMASGSSWSSHRGPTVKPSSASPSAIYCSAPSPYLWPTAAGESNLYFKFEF